MEEIDLYEQSKEYFKEGDRLYSQNEREQAIETYTKGLALVPESVYGLVRRGVARQELEDTTGALTDFETAIAIDPTYGPAYFGRGWVRHTMGDYEGEIADARLGLTLDPLDPSKYWRRLGSGFVALHREQEGLHAYSEAIRLNPKDRGTLLNRAILYTDLKRYEDALADFDRLREVSPTWDWAHRERAVLLGLMGRWSEAVTELEHLVEQHPHNMNYRRRLEKAIHMTTAPISWRDRLLRKRTPHEKP